MKAMARICAPCRLSFQCSLHASTARFKNTDTSTTSHDKPQEDMNFMKAAEILFSEDKSNRRKKFGWDFHLWQAFVACLPSVAVYLTAQYARHDMEKVRVKLDEINVEKLKSEEEKQEQEARKAPGFRMIEERLDKMEEKISKIESTAAQTKATAMEESKAAKVEENQEGKVRAGGADNTVQGFKDAKAPGKTTQNILAKEGNVKGHGRDGKKVDSPAPSKAA